MSSPSHLALLVDFGWPVVLDCIAVFPSVIVVLWHGESARMAASRVGRETAFVVPQPAALGWSWMRTLCFGIEGVPGSDRCLHQRHLLRQLTQVFATHFGNNFVFRHGVTCRLRRFRGQLKSASVVRGSPTAFVTAARIVCRIVLRYDVALGSD